jgi:hypothetical protein
MAGGRHPFHVIDGTPAPDTAKERRRDRLKKALAPSDTLRCPRCTAHALLEIKLGSQIRRGGKPYGATKQLICVMCLKDGEYVVVY